MKFNVQEIPQAALRDGVLVGDVYKAKGGSGSTCFFLVVAVVGRVCHALGLDKGGNVVSTTSYGTHVFESRELLGRCEALVDFNPVINWSAF